MSNTRLIKLLKVARKLSHAMVETEAKGGNYSLVDKEWEELTAVIIETELAFKRKEV